jgi:tRNA(adenine34) deaminase
MMSKEEFMEEALMEARLAEDKGEVPIGAIIVKDGLIVGRGHNLTELSKDPTNHSEMIAIREASSTIGGWRLSGCEMYVTLEPCSMCAGAIVLSRLDKVYIGTMDPKTGACGSLMNILQDERLNHFVEIEAKVLEDQCQNILKKFFVNIRNQSGRKK